MLSYIRNILGTYTPLSGEGIASLNIEYIVQAVLLLLCFWLVFKTILYFISALFRLGK